MRLNRVSPTRVISALAVGLALALGLTGCGFNAQTLQSDSPGQGVNVDANDIAIRDIVLVVTGEHTGRLTGAILSPDTDKLVSVEGYPLKDGEPGEQFVTTGAPLSVTGGELFNLTEGDKGIMLSSPDLEAGYDAQIEFTFSSGASATTKVVVLDTESMVFSSVTPVPNS